MRASRGISIHTGMAFLRNEFYNMSIYRVSFWINLFYTFLMMYSVGYVWRALYAANPNVSERIRCAVYMDTCTRVIITSVDETGLCQSNDTGRLRKCGTFDYMVIFCVWLFWEKHNIRLIFLWG